MGCSEAQFKALNILRANMPSSSCSLFLLERHTGLGWQENGNVEPRAGVQCTEKLSSSADA